MQTPSIALITFTLAAIALPLSASAEVTEGPRRGPAGDVSGIGDETREPE